jgi:hypothetical protein
LCDVLNIEIGRLRLMCIESNGLSVAVMEDLRCGSC